MKTIKEATQTKSGKLVKIYATNAGGPYPIHGAVWEPLLQQWYIENWRSDGEHYVTERALDLQDWEKTIPWEFLDDSIIEVYWDPSYKQWYGFGMKTSKSLSSVKMPTPSYPEVKYSIRRPKN